MGSVIFSKSAKIFFFAFFVSLSISLLWAYHKYMVRDDYEIYLPDESDVMDEDTNESVII